MKIILFGLALLVSSFRAFGSEHVPATVEKAFSAMYPGIQNPHWEKREGCLVATFRDMEGLKKAFFLEDGRWKETRIRMMLEELPMGVKSFIRENYHRADITFAGKILVGEGILYRIESELPGKIVIKVLDADGQLLKQEEISFYQLLPDKTAAQK